MNVSTSAIKKPTLEEEVEVQKSSSSMYDVLQHEMKPFLELALPTVILQIGFVFSPLITASYVGRKFGSVYLSGYTLANLTGNLSALSLLSGLYSASDTLSPQAFGAGNHREVGLLAIRGFLGSLIIILSVNVLLVPNMISILSYLGQDDEASLYASQWYCIYVIALPFYSLFNAIWKFLSAQNIMKPLLFACIISSLVVLPVTLEIFTAWYGFIGTAYAFLSLQVSQVLIVLSILWWKQPHVAATWPGLRDWRDALEYDRVVEYLTLGAGGMLAQSEWIYWEALGLIIGTLGVVPLSVHTIPTQMIMAAFMTPLGIGTALSIRMGISLPVNVRRTKLLVIGTLVISTIFFTLTSILMYMFRYRIYSLFTTEELVIEGAESIWWKVCIYSFFISFFAAAIGVVTGLGMQWTLGVVNFVFLWVIGIPISYCAVVMKGQGLGAAWTWIIAPYFGIDVTLIIAFMLKDWDAFSRDIQKREGMIEDKEAAPALKITEGDIDGEPNEATELLA